MANIFDQKSYEKVSKEVEVSFHDFIQEMREDIKQKEARDIFSEDFVKKLAPILSSPDLESYGPLKFYWVNLLDNLTYVGQIHRDLAKSFNISSRDEKSELEEELFNFWNDSDLAQSFHLYMGEDLSIEDASFKLLPLLEAQVLAFFELQINTQEHLDTGVIYKAVPEIGDSSFQIYLSDKKHAIPFAKDNQFFPLFNIDFEPTAMRVRLDQELSTSAKLESASKYKLNNHNLWLVPNCHEGLKNHKKLQEKTLKALDIIQKATPDLYQVLIHFTSTVVPINESGVVSYSMQSLPKHSCINLFERDLLDLVDDLLHENGHHFLNSHLNTQELILEDDEKIYYSPWRKALRPIRGIYHGALTFFWALKLFADLDIYISKNGNVFNFSQAELEKIKRRGLEEFLMINFTQELVTLAFNEGKVTEEGQALANQFFNQVQKYSSWSKECLEELKKAQGPCYKEIQELIQELKKQEEHYHL